VYEYGDDHYRRTVEEARLAGWELPKDILDRAPTRPATPSPLVNYLRNFQQLCFEYDLRSLYVAYRTESAGAHPTQYSAFPYLRAPIAGSSTPGLSSHAEGPTEQYLIWPAVCLIQAGLVMSPVMKGDPLRSQLQAAADHLRIPLDLLPKRGATKLRRSSANPDDNCHPSASPRG
jgi:hypothetical protein